MKIKTKLLLVLCLGTLVGGCTSVDKLAKSSMSEMMATYGYSLYTPFRTTDLPGTIFVLSENHEGKWTEFTVAGFREAFAIAPQLPFAKAEQEVGMVDVFSKNYSFSSSLGLELVSLVIKPELAYTYAETVSIKLVSPKTTHVMSSTRLAEISRDLNVNTKRVLTDLKLKNQLNHAYLVFETVTVSGIEIEVTLKPAFKASVDIEKFRKLASLDAKMEASSDGKLTIKYDKPMIVGYKARRVPDTLLSGEVSPMLTMEAVSPAEINAIKSR